MFYVYVLENKAQEHYIGFTKNLKKRVQEHNLGDTQSTRDSSWRCIYYEACLDEDDARRREKYLKTTQGRRMLKRRLKEYLFKLRAS